MISFAQNFEDVILERIFGDIENGCYVDVGACHPYYDSVTKHFYQKGWRGLNVEPVPELYKLLVEDREFDFNVNCAIGEQAETTTLFITDSLANSTISGDIGQAYSEKNTVVKTLDVEVKTLDQVIADTIGSQHIHFLKVDVEGFEKQVLSSVNLAELKPDVLVIEATLPNSQTPSYQVWEHLILDHYQFFYFDGVNRFYHHKAFQLDVAKVSLPPNVFDRFKTYQSVNAENDLLVKEEQLKESAIALDDAYKAIAQKDQEYTELAHLQSLGAANAVGDLPQRFDKANQDIATLQTKNAELEQIIFDKSQQLAKVLDALEHLKSLVRDKEQHLMDAEVSYQSLQKSVTELQLKAKENAEVLIRKDRELNESIAAVDNFQTAIQEKEAALAHASKAFEELTSTLASKEQALSEALSELNKRQNSQLENQELKDAQKAYNALLTEFDTKNLSLQHAQNAYQDLLNAKSASEQAHLDALESANSAYQELEHAYKISQENLTEAQQALADLYNKVESNQNELQDAGLAYQELAKSLAAKERYIIELQDEAQRTANVLTQKDQELCQAQAAVDDVHRYLKDKEQVLLSSVQAHRDMSAKFDDASLHAQQLTEALHDSQQYCEDLISQLAAKTKELEVALDVRKEMAESSNESSQINKDSMNEIEGIDRESKDKREPIQDE